MNEVSKTPIDLNWRHWALILHFLKKTKMVSMMTISVTIPVIQSVLMTMTRKMSKLFLGTVKSPPNSQIDENAKISNERKRSDDCYIRLNCEYIHFIRLPNRFKRKRVDSMSEHFKAAGFKMRRTSKADEKLEQQEKANRECTHLLRTLLDKLDKISPYLPGNALDELMDGLGGPDMVAEMTGRRNRYGIHVCESQIKNLHLD